MFGGKARVPLTVRTSTGAGLRAAAQHSQSLYWMTTGDPRAEDRHPLQPGRCQGPAARRHPRRRPGGLLRAEVAALRLRRGAGGRLRGPASGKARWCARAATCRWSASGAPCRPRCRRRPSWRSEGISAEVLDLRSLQPLDEEAILATLREDRPPGGDRRGAAALWHRQRRRGAVRRSRLRLPQRPGEEGDRAAYAGALQPGARGRLRSHGRRRCSPPCARWGDGRCRPSPCRSSA